VWKMWKEYHFVPNFHHTLNSLHEHSSCHHVCKYNYYLTVVISIERILMNVQQSVCDYTWNRNLDMLFILKGKFNAQLNVIEVSLHANTNSHVNSIHVVRLIERTCSHTHTHNVCTFTQLFDVFSHTRCHVV
jgi:hypothetical protein